MVAGGACTTRCGYTYATLMRHFSCRSPSLPQCPGSLGRVKGALAPLGGSAALDPPCALQVRGSRATGRRLGSRHRLAAARDDPHPATDRCDHAVKVSGGQVRLSPDSRGSCSPSTGGGADDDHAQEARWGGPAGGGVSPTSFSHKGLTATAGTSFPRRRGRAGEPGTRRTAHPAVATPRFRSCPDGALRRGGRQARRSQSRRLAWARRS